MAPFSSTFLPLLLRLNPAGEAWPLPPEDDWTGRTLAQAANEGVRLPVTLWQPLLTLDGSQRVTWTAPLLRDLLGYEAEPLGQPVQSLLASSLDAARLQLLEASGTAGVSTEGTDTGEVTDLEMEFQTAGGEVRNLLIRAAPLRGLQLGDAEQRGGLVLGCLWPTAAARSSLPAKQYTMISSVLDSMASPLVLLDPELRYTYCNPQAIRNDSIRQWIIGHTDEEYVAYRGFDPALAQRRRKYLERAIKTRSTVSFEEVFHHPQRVVQLRTYTPVFGPDGSLVYILGNGLEITELRRAQQELQTLNDELEARVQARTRQLEDMAKRLQYDAFHDSLTGLPNRALLYDRLQQALRRASVQEDHYAVLYLDTDHFKSINDTLGHPTGDAVLVEVANRLRQSVRASDTVARLSGDEFMVLLEPLSTPEHATQIASRIQAELRRPIAVSGFEVTVSVSMGIVMCCVPGLETAVDILRDADIAMYRAKAAGRDSYVIFEPQMREHALRQTRLANDLRQALNQEALTVAYQPIVRLATRQVAGFEALVRWEHPERGFISPADFMPVAEESGLLLEIDRWVLRRACTDMVEQQRRSPAHPLSLSVNFSARHFTSSNVFAEVQQTLQDTGFDPQQLHIEITETALLGRPQTVVHTLSSLRSLGVSLHIDDFGTGYSSLSYLHSYPLDTLKIDRSFVQDMTTQASSAELVKTITVMAQNMEMEVVAEGIETPQQLQMLLDLGCTYGQGYLLARPLPLAQAWAVAQEGIAAASD